MQENEVKELLKMRRFTVLFSGGKDSTACLLWVYNNVDSKNFRILYVEMYDNTAEECNAYVHKVVEELGLSDKLIHVKATYNDLSFFQLVEQWGLPLVKYHRWCLYKVKMPAFVKFIDGFPVTGVRASDSSMRAKILRNALSYSKYMKKWTVNPIWDWKKEEVFSYIKENGFEVNPCYDLYGHGGNCMFCPYADKKRIVKTLNSPAWREKILSAVEKCRENLLKGEIGRQIYERWTKYASYRTLQTSLSI